ncbi:hypothetical protein Tco_1569571 [Tanacetum coccineum]
MAIETKKNAASGSTVIDENRGQDDVRQNPKKRGMSKDVVASLDQRVAGVETSMAELKSQVEGLEGRKRYVHGRDRKDTRGVWRIVDDASKIKMATQYLKDTATLWWRRRYGDIKLGTTTIITWLNFVVDFKKQFYQENAKNKAKSRIYSLFYFLDGLQGWAKTELERCGVQDLSTTIAHAKALIDFSTRRDPSKLKDKKVNQEKGGGEKNAQPKKAEPQRNVAHETNEASRGKIWVSDKDLKCNQGKDRDAEGCRKRPTISGSNHQRCPAAVTRLETDEDSSKVEVPKVIERVLDKFKDVMPKELPKKLPPRREVDHIIELETGSKPPAKAPYRMPPPELEELRNQLKDLMDASYIRPLKGPYGAPVLFQRKKANTSHQVGFDYRGLPSYGSGGRQGQYDVVSLLGLLQFLVIALFGLYQCDAVTFSNPHAKLWRSVLSPRDQVNVLRTQESKDGGFNDGRELLPKVHHGILGHIILFDGPIEEGTKAVDKWTKKCQAVVRVFVKKGGRELWAGHPGITRMLALVEGTYYCLRMGDDVETFVRTCLICQQDKIEQEKLGGLLEPLPTQAVTHGESVFHGTLSHACLRSEARTSRLVPGHRWHKVRLENEEVGRMKRENSSSMSRDQVMVKLLPQQFKSLRKVYKGLIRRYEGPFSVIGRVGKIQRDFCWIDDPKDEEAEAIRVLDMSGITTPDSEASWEAEDLLWQFMNEIKRYHEDGTTRTSRA